MTSIHSGLARRLRHLPATTARALLAGAVAMACALPAQAAPAGGVVTAGAGAISQQGATTTITQAASQTQQPARMVIDWNSFSSAAGEAIVFNQPNAAAIALNRVTGASPSQLMGSLTANGQVFILNPNGVLFGPGSQVNVRGLLASTLAMDNAGFMQGSHVLQGSSSASVVNRGSLKAADGGYIALVSPSVINDGALSANKGDALLAAGDKVTLRLEGGSLIGYSMDLGSVNALVDNTANGAINAHGGRVVLEARAADALSKAVVNHAGLIEAQTLNRSEGSIKLLANLDVGQATVSGTLDASAPNGGNGGIIETSAARVKIADSTKVTTLAANGVTGSWLIDPLDFEIGPGNSAETISSIGANKLAATLDHSNVILGTSTSGAGNGQGDITVNADVAWEANTLLILKAYRDIVFNASLRGKSVSLQYGQASPDGGKADFYFSNGARIDLTGPGGTFTTQKGSNAANLTSYIIVSSLGDQNRTDKTTLQGIIDPGANENFVLGADIDAAPTMSWNNGAGFTPLGNLYGTLEGLGHRISSLNIVREKSSVIGLFGSIRPGAAVRNLGIDAFITGDDTVGALAGSNIGIVSNVYVTGNVNGRLQTGGLVGINDGIISDSHSAATVKGNEIVGGLAGINNATGSIGSSYATGNVLATDILSSTGQKLATFTGGLLGINHGSVAGSYTTGDTAGNAGVGGLVGGSNGNIENSYALGRVNGHSFVGGLVGRADAGSSIKNSYASGAVQGTEAASTHGLVGMAANGGTSNSYWNTDSVAAGGTGQSAPGEGGGKTGAQLRQAATFGNWDIAATGGSQKVWRIYEGNSMPLLRSFLPPLVLDSARREYSAAVQQNPAIPSVDGRTAVAASGRNVGTYQPYSNQQGYDIVNGELAITPRPLDITALIDAKVYDGTTAASATLSDNRIAGDQLILPNNPLASFDNKNVGNGKTATVTGITLGGADAANYAYKNAITTTGNITPLNYVYSVGASDKFYDGTTNAAVTLAGNQIDTDDLRISATASFGDKNAGNAKAVTVTALSLEGADAGNYTFAAGGETTASIKQRPLDITATAADKVYDGTTSAQSRLNDNRVAGDALAINAVANFDDKNAGAGKNVTISGIAITGADAANYLVQQQQVISTSASITQRPLDITTATAADKIYDGTAAAQAILQDNRLAGDALVTNAVASFDDKNAGAGKNVTISGIAITGADAPNYLYQTQAMTARASITPRPIAITSTASDKAYDGDTRASAALFDNRIAGDALSASYQRADFADKNAGEKKNVTVSGIALAGADALNYLPNTSTTTRASIAPIKLVITANPDSRLADGVPYQGGNGVTYAGLLPGETAAVLDGELRYSGSAQRATSPGVYRITPGGQRSVNYASTFVDGTLTIQPLPPGADLIAAYTEPAVATPLPYAGRSGADSLLVVDCGMRMPENLQFGGCQPAAPARR